MGLKQIFLPEKLPQQWLYVGEDHVQICRFNQSHTLEYNQIIAAPLSASADSFLPLNMLKSELLALETGIVLNPAFFIFNIFEFDAIPWQNKMRDEIIFWRLQKVFPENIDAYEHRYTSIQKRRFLSILIKKSTSEMIENIFYELKIPLIYLGSSTLALINSIFVSKNTPDFFIELEKSQVTIVFQRKGKLLYVRKFKYEHAQDVAEECIKTTQFVATTFAKDAHTFALICPDSDSIASERISAEIQQHNLQFCPINEPMNLYFQKP